ncbi:MAG TPA: hypothetical protein VGD97_04345 [Lacunisphaera sp.]
MKKSSIILFLALAGIPCAADTAYSPPVGGMTFTVNGGTVVAPVTTWFAVPVLDEPLASGAGRGKITSFTSGSITLTGAGWTSGALSNAAFPYAVRLLSGAGEGATLSVSANTTDTLTVSGRDLVQLGVVVGDVFQLVPVDTLNTLFGPDTFLGGVDANSADVITLSSSVQLAYYYNTTLGHWVRTTGPTTDRGNTPIPLGSVIAVTRKSGGMTLRIVGRVPETKVNALVANAGSTYTHTGFPTNVTIGSLALQTAIPGWVSASVADNADMLAVNVGGTWLNYFHNGTNWQRTTGPATNRDSIVINAGTAVQFFKRGSASGSAVFTRLRPYSF